MILAHVATISMPINGTSHFVRVDRTISCLSCTTEATTKQKADLPELPIRISRQSQRHHNAVFQQKESVCHIFMSINLSLKLHQADMVNRVVYKMA